MRDSVLFTYLHEFSHRHTFSSHYFLKSFIVRFLHFTSYPLIFYHIQNYSLCNFLFVLMKCFSLCLLHLGYWFMDCLKFIRFFICLYLSCRFNLSSLINCEALLFIFPFQNAWHRCKRITVTWSFACWTSSMQFLTQFYQTR